jgi:hypothetical protein
MGYTHAREEPDHRVHVGVQHARRHTACRSQVFAEGYTGAIAWRRGPKGKLSIMSVSRHTSR